MKIVLPILWFCLLPFAVRANVNKLYNQHCAVCHGNQGEGGLGSSLTNQQWQYGSSDAEIAAVIRDGLPALGMQAYEGILTEEEIRSMVIYIQELEARANRPKPPPLTAGVFQSDHQNFRLETLLENREKMWGISFLPDNRVILTEIDGPVKILDANGTLGPPIQGIPESVRRGQGGMLDVAVHPDYAENGWIYLAFSEGEPNNSITSIFRGRVTDNTWVDEEVIYRAEKKFRSRSGVHYGSRIVFKDGYLFFSIGDRGAQNQAQQLNRPNGKIHRLHDDGRIPADNPFVGGNRQASIWTYGNRNPQALAFRPGTDELWSTEHGPRGGDELNRIRPGLNYGWPKVTYGMNYNGTPITEHTSLPGLEPPLWHWTPSIAVCGMAFADGTVYPGWKGDLMVGGLRGQVIERIRIGDDGVEEREVILKNQGRVRDIKTGNDGFLYVILEGNGSKLVRLVPAM